jgi:peptidyl-prolyl cis-trans isomerase SurA
MTFFDFRQSTAVLILSASLSAVPSLAQATTPSAHTAADTAPVNGKVVEDIVARVNDQIVTQSDYDRAAEQQEAEAKQQAIPAQQLAQKQADLLRDLIDQQLLLSKAKELGITGETELIKHLDDLRKQNHLESMEELEKAYSAQAQGTSFEDFKASIRNSIVTQQVVRDEVGRHITMSPGDVQKYYKEHASEFAQPESVTLNEIFIPTPGKTATEAPDPAEVAAAQAKADALEAKLAAGAKFEDLAKPAPADPNDPKTVALGEFRRGGLAKEIEDKAFALNAGQYTQPIRTKQGFIILQVTDHTRGGDADFKKMEPQIEEALFLERMQPELRKYLTQLRDQAYVELKPGVVDTGASGNEMRLSYSAYVPPAEKKKKKFVRTRFRGRDRSRHVTAAAVAAAGAAAAPPAPSTATAAAPGAAKTAASTQQASNNDVGIQKPGKREKIRFGQAPRESLPSSQVASAAAPDNTPGVTTPESRVVNPDGTISSATAPVNEKKTRLSSRPPVKKVKQDKSADTPPAATADELATQKVQDSPLGLADPAAQKKPKKGEKTRYSAKPKQEDQAQPYLGQPATPAGSVPAPPASQQPAPEANPGAPATAPSGSTPPASTPPASTPPAAQQP